MQFVVRALDAGQEVQTLVLDAFDEADAREQAAARRLTPLSVRRGGTKTAAFPLLLFAQELLALLTAGLSVMESLDALMDKEGSPDRRVVLARLASQLREGLRLSAAMQQQPVVFPPLFIGIVQAAESTSDLPRALGRYVDYESRSQAVRHKVLSAAIYPAVLLAVGGAVTLFLLGYVVPRFASVYQGGNRELPWASRALMEWGSLVQTHALPVVAVLAAIVVLVGWRARHALRRQGWVALLQWLPGARERLRTLEIARLYLTLGMLLEGGIALPRALALCTSLLDEDGARRLEAVRTRIESGSPLSDALQAQDLSTSIALRLLRVGERSGQLAGMLDRTAAFYELEVGRWIERFSKAFEPVLMAAIGLVIGLIVILLYMPIFELAGSLK